MTQRIPVVAYLDLDDEPTLVGTACTSCGATYLGRRLACANCGGRAFEQRPLPRTGRLRSFSIIHRAAEGLSTPFVSGVVALEDETAVKANIVNCPPDPDHVRLGMPLSLTTFIAGEDREGSTAVAFAFEPAHEDLSA